MTPAWKRSIDLLAATLLLIAAAPLMLLVAVAIAATLGRPVFFRQERPGLGGRLFTLIKFRTMRDAHDRHGRPLDDASRLTPFGRWLRSTSLDELPSLFNVLAGEMTLVGPRPLLPKYLPRYSARQACRHEVAPGLTGWAQVNGRNLTSWEERLEHDVWYVENRSFGLDCLIAAKTVVAVLSRHGTSAQGHATMPEFPGNGADDGSPNSEKHGVLVIGAGGHARVAIATLKAVESDVASAHDDDPGKWDSVLSGVPVVGPVSRLRGTKNRSALIAVGDNSTRQRLAGDLQFDWITVVHPAAHVDPMAQIGRGSLVCAGATIQAGAVVGEHAIVNTNATVDHDARIGDFAHLGPGAVVTGGVRIGIGAFLGAGAVVTPGVSVGRGAIAGAGSVVLDDVPAEFTVVGAPARPIQKTPRAAA